MEDVDRALLAAPVRATYRRCLMAGLSARECNVLVARLHGLKGDYTPQQVTKIIFIRELRRQGKIES